MAGAKCNATIETSAIGDEYPQIVPGLTTHGLLVVLASCGTAIAVILSQIQISRHARLYLKPWEQRHIIRILFMISVYSVSNLLTVIYYRYSVYFELLGNTYAAIALASFFNLLTNWIAPDLHSQKDYFRRVSAKNYAWPLSWLQKCFGGQRGPFRRPRSGLTWFNILWCGVFQYALILFTMSLVGVATQASGRYCQESLDPAFAHIWILTINGISGFIAGFCLDQFYLQTQDDLAEHKPGLKKFCVSVVLFWVTLVQTIVITGLVATWPGGHSVIKPGPYISSPDLRICLAPTCACVEMAFIAILHLFAYRSNVYKPARQQQSELVYQGGMLGWRATVDAMNPWDLVKATGRGMRWLVTGWRTREQDMSYRSIQINAPSGFHGSEAELVAPAALN